MASTVLVDALVRADNLGPDNQAGGGTARLEAVYAADRLAFGERYGSCR